MGLGTDFGKGVHEPGIHRRNLFEGLHEKLTAGFGVGERPVGAAMLNPERRHQRIQAVVGNILEGDSRKGQGIPYRVILEIYPNFCKCTFQKTFNFER